MKSNLILRSDSYKYSHWLQYPPGTTYMQSYIESRGGKFKETLFFGLQYFLKEYLTTPITEEMVFEAERFMALHGEPFNLEGWLYIARDLQGKLPVRIRALPEGSVVPVGNALVIIESTDPQVFWIASWLETQLLRAVWYPTTVATLSMQIKRIIYQALENTADDPDGEIGFKLHDFGARGVSSAESAGIGGMAHLVNFLGSDTVEGVHFANYYYSCLMAGFSIPAAEHSTMTSWTRLRELEAYRNMLQQYGGKYPLIAVVSDSYDLFNAVENLWGSALKAEVIHSGSTLIIRPDSGDPPSVVLKTLQLLEKQFGHTVNSKGYKVLNHVRVIQGDGIDYESVQAILGTIIAHSYSATNVAFGMGGGLLQQINRDTQKFAMKCNVVQIDGEDVPVFKDPVTDHGKRSKSGRLEVRQITPSYFKTLPADQLNETLSALRTVYENGQILVDYTFEEVRKTAAAGFTDLRTPIPCP